MTIKQKFLKSFASYRPIMWTEKIRLRTLISENRSYQEILLVTTLGTKVTLGLLRRPVSACPTLETSVSGPGLGECQHLYRNSVPKTSTMNRQYCLLLDVRTVSLCSWRLTCTRCTGAKTVNGLQRKEQQSRMWTSCSWETVFKLDLLAVKI